MSFFGFGLVFLISCDPWRKIIHESHETDRQSLLTLFPVFLVFLENALFHGNIDTALRNETPLKLLNSGDPKQENTKNAIFVTGCFRRARTD